MKRTRASARPLVMGVDVGGTKTALMACDVDGDVARLKFETPRVPPAEFMTYLAGFMALTLHEAGGGFERLAALGIAIPGPVDPSTGRVLVAGNLGGWRDVPLRELASQRFGVPAFVEHDANAAALGERWRGCAQGVDDFVFLALGTGIGAGIVLDGKLHRGHRFAAGEVGNFILSRKHLTQPGKRRTDGDLAKLVGGPAIRAAALRAVHEKVSAAATLAVCLVAVLGGSARSREGVRGALDVDANDEPRRQRHPGQAAQAQDAQGKLTRKGWPLAANPWRALRKCNVRCARARERFAPIEVCTIGRSSCR